MKNEKLNYNKKKKNNKINRNNKIDKKFRIIIWRQNVKGEIRCAHCCNWCMKLLQKYNICNHIQTFKIINNYCYFENSYIESLNIKPLLKNQLIHK